MEKEELKGINKVRFATIRSTRLRNHVTVVAMDSGPTIPDWKTETGRFLTELQQIFRIVRYAAALMITTKVMIVAMNQGIAVATVKLSQRKSFLNSSMSLRKPRMSTSNLSNGFILLRHSFGCVFFCVSYY